MTRELRRIYFNVQELADAIGGFRKVDSKFLPPGKISDLEVAEEHVAIKIEMRYVDNLHVLDFVIPYAKMTDILVNYCVERNVPLPRLSKRAVGLIEGEVVLEIMVGEAAGIGVGAAAAVGGR